MYLLEKQFFIRNAPESIPVDISKIYWKNSKEQTGMQSINELLLTPERLYLYQAILNDLILYLKNQPYEKLHMITGFQGIGKSVSLLLFSHLLIQIAKKSKNQIRVVLIPDCLILSMNDLLQQFILHFPEKQTNFENALKAPNWKIQIDEVKKTVTEFTSEGNIAILIADQINNLCGKGIKILSELREFPWTLILFTESANNYLNTDKTYKLFKRHECNSFISDILFEKVLILERPLLDIPLNDFSFKKIKSWTAINPREGIKVLDSNGKNLDEKIQNYIFYREVEVVEEFLKFLNELSTEFKESLYQSVFYMDKDIEFESLQKPVIDNRMMIRYEVIPNKLPAYHVWKIFSGFPLASHSLKKFCNQEKFSSTFYINRKKELIKIVNDPTINPKMRGVCFEELIHTNFNISRKLNDEIGIFICPSNYLKKIQEPINYDVFYDFILYYFIFT